MTSKTPVTPQDPRRAFLHTVAAGGAGVLLGTLPTALAAKSQQPEIAWERIRLGPGNAVLDVPENRSLLGAIGKARELTPEQLLAIAAQYRDNPATAALAYRLAASAMAAITSHPAVERAISSIARTEVPGSFFGDVWKAVKNFFTGGTDQKNPAQCKYKCIAVALVEKCGDNDAWHIIGICIGFKW
jgi:hypothetical protein